MDKVLTRKELGQRIKEARKFRRMTLQEVASDVLGRDGRSISHHTLAKIEAGIQEPYWYYVAQIAKSLDVELNDFL
jgi:transcriptional regulator with XRE-family HTH domain